MGKILAVYWQRGWYVSCNEKFED